ncbi:hypothetical protein [Candidatus Bodocaedibacter vickermanii]|uniref:Uncharacterized protein n=1 Tax=Candidatus Bodocaedibacter vickermanii TaxID=2741701 RepID=A0A7L9RSB6_9PROT|nr:hypothetical protein CPBP_00178 [Candidatus Paracaedibacteraceae bacterium 'Lake Konstanz']
MNRFLITLMVSSFSTLSAAEPHSPTQQYQANLQRIESRIQSSHERQETIRECLILLKYSDQRDLNKPESDALKVFQLQKEINRKKYAQELIKLKREIKKLSKEKKQLESTQIYSSSRIK